MIERVSLSSVADAEQSEFLAMAVDYFTELNPAFLPRDDWRTKYFPRLKHQAGVQVQWIEWDGIRAGFVIYGVESHRFLPRKNGWVYEFYVTPPFRGKGVGKQAAEQVLQALRLLSPAKIQLEVSCGNAKAAEFWNYFRFKKVAERYVLEEVEKVRG